MLSEHELKNLAEKAIEKGLKLGATQVEVVLWSGVEDLTRFANNEIHQSMSLDDVVAHVRVIINKKIGVARGNSADLALLLGIVDKAYEIARLQKADPSFGSLPAAAKYKDFAKVYDRHFHLGAMGRAKAIKVLIDVAKAKKLSASGAFVESEGSQLVANSLGVLAYSTAKSANLSTIVSGKFGSGFAEQTAIGGKDIDYKDVARRAVLKATMFGEPREVPAGEYEVILEPAAVSELMDFFVWLGPNGRVYHEDVSFFQGNMGKQIFDRKLTITDDPAHKDIFPSGFDLEGFPKSKLEIVKRGRPVGVAYDSYHANKYRKKNTGHALVAPNTWGPVATHIVIHPGTLTQEAMIKKVKRGLLVTRFWYTRVVSHKDLILTGMTRDGTFLIENGKIVARVKNLRYTQSVLSTFAKIKGIGRELRLTGSEGWPALVPHLHLAKFNFSSGAEHA